MLNLYELANVIREPLKVTILNGKVLISFLNCELKEYQHSTIIGGDITGTGATVDEAADDCFRKISGKWLVFHDTSYVAGGKREYAAEIAQKIIRG